MGDQAVEKNLYCRVVRYRADITAGSLKVVESRIIADLLLREAGQQQWRKALLTQNVLQVRHPATAVRLARLIR
jgi:bacteriophage exclusion system BrxA-like protein